MKKVLFALMLVMIVSTSVSAQCNCICVNNEKQMICSNTWDVPVGWCGGYCYNNY